MPEEATRYPYLSLLPYLIQTYDSLQDMVIHSFLLLRTALHYVPHAVPHVLPVLERQTQHLYPLQNANLPTHRTGTVLPIGVHLCVHGDSVSQLSDGGTE